MLEDQYILGGGERSLHIRLVSLSNLYITLVPEHLSLKQNRGRSQCLSYAFLL